MHELIAEKCDCECAGIYQPLQNYHSCNHWNFVLTFLIGRCNNIFDFGHLSIIAELDAKSTPVCNVKLDISIRIILKRAEWYKTRGVFLLNFIISTIFSKEMHFGDPTVCLIFRSDFFCKCLIFVFDIHISIYRIYRVVPRNFWHRTTPIIGH